MIDLRSDTLTRPTAAMREAIAHADVGDDVWGEDPTVNRLEQRVAEWLGLDAAVYNCSGTQSNQMALWAHCTPGDEVLIEESGHIANAEAGAAAALSGVTLRTLRGRRGLLDIDDVADKIRASNLHFAPTRVLCLENSTNFGGGATYPLAQLERLSHWARAHGLQVHLDGARFFNACQARGYRPAQVAALLDSVSLCFSKGLGCPMGSILVGSHALIQRARRARKMMGGGLRQAGMMAAAAMYALDHHIERLADDHQHARRLAAGLATIPGLSITLDDIETNLVFFEVTRDGWLATDLADSLRALGVLILPMGPRRLRACTHLDVNQAEIDTALAAIRQVMTSTADTPR